MNRKFVIVFLLFVISFGTSAYAADQSTTAPSTGLNSEKLTTINADNLNQLIITISNDFFHQLSQIKTQYQLSYDHRDARSFLVWRLRDFMPEQTQLETHYQTLFNSNKEYLATTDVEGLLPAFKQLSEITISLIEAIRDANEEKMKLAQKQIDAAVASYDKVIKAHNLDDKVKR